VSTDARDDRLLLELVGDDRAPIELPRQGVLRIGSSKEKSDLCLAGQGIADVHCAVRRIKSGGWALQDLGGQYGTLVNGARVQQHKLGPGDLIVVGSRRLRVIEASASVAVAAPTAPKPAPIVEEPAVARAVDSSRLPTVKGFRIERPLGRGGMGEVYLAVQESLGRPVALKVLASKLAADADFVRRFQAEARAAAALNHPNVVTVHDVWEDGGRHFLAMEFMDRGNLEQRVQRDGKLGQREAVDVLCDAAKALLYAELRGIVHRDIKPANLMQNQVGTTKLADLGLAMHLEAEATESDNRKIYGTPHFISPEQARGEKVDIRSDLYSLGATMYRLLSGRTPFEGATTRDILRGHFLEAPKPLADLVPEIAPSLAQIVHRMLEKKPDARFASAAVLLQEVERLRSAAVVGAAAAAPARSSRTWAAGVLVLVVAAIAYVALRGDGDADGRDGDPAHAIADHTADPGRTAVDSTGDPGDRGVDVEGANHERGRDDDTQLKLRQIEAENALLKISSELSSSEREAELRALAERYSGTEAAARALSEADLLRTAAEQAAAEAAARDSATRTWTERLRLAAVTDAGPKPLSEAVRALLAIEPPAGYAESPVLADQRRAVFADVLRAGLDRAAQAATALDELERTGRFDQFQTELESWIAALDLPPLPVELGVEAVPTVGDVLGLKRTLEKRLDGIPAARTRFAGEVARADRAALARALRGSAGSPASLLDFEAAAVRLDALDGQLASAEARAFVGELERGNWKRKSISDPRTRSRAAREVVGASGQGLTIKTDGGVELIPFAAFAARPVDLHQLFHQRLTREYTPAEAAGIETLLRVSAVSLAVTETSDMLAADARAVLSEDEEHQIFEALDAVRPWAAMANATARLEREIEAAKVLTVALRAGTSNSWSQAVAALERLLGEFQATLLVRMLSDGRGV
jgi:hypothetical protein